MTMMEYDFRKPPPSVLEAKVKEWLLEACYQSSRLWSEILTFHAELSDPVIEAITGRTALERLPEIGIGFRLSANEFLIDQPILASTRPPFLALLASSMGEEGKSLPEDRDLTLVENSVCDFLVQQLFLDLLSETWPSSLDELRFSIQDRGLPRLISKIPPNDLVLFVTFMLKGSFAPQPIYLILPRSGFLEELIKPLTGAATVEANPLKDQIEALVKEMPVEFSVTLGTTQITLLQLARLRKGDVILLEQKVSEPLSAKVAGSDKFSVWPGASGRRQAIQIEQLLRPE
jgi:flagellar motor switch protein FliM